MCIINVSARILKQYTYRSSFNFSAVIRNMSQLDVVASTEWLDRARYIIPSLSNTQHKGQAGRIGVIGGSLEYTGAPYFAAISALKVGADIVHVFCMKDAASVIKSYSPELIVHPLLDADDPIESIEPWLERLHVLVIGPGLGRVEKVLDTVSQLIQLCNKLNIPLVIDADGLFLLAQDFSIMNDCYDVILTPNAMEFERLFGKGGVEFEDKIGQIRRGHVTVLEKGFNDKIYTSGKLDEYLLTSGGSGRRCGGQGDLLSGALATFFCWAVQHGDRQAAKVACYAASSFAKECNRQAFLEKGRSMTASDMVQHIHAVFDEMFESKPKDN